MPPKSVNPPKLSWADLEQIAATAPNGSPLRETAWLDLKIGDAGIIPDPPKIYDAVAALAYRILDQQDELQDYISNMKLYQLPGFTIDSVDTHVYRKYVTALLITHCADFKACGCHPLGEH